MRTSRDFSAPLNSLIRPFTPPDHTQATGTIDHHPYTTRNKSLTITSKRVELSIFLIISGSGFYRRHS
ncbi:hypothetical protein J6590_042006 [Homalodisca vitripennis]|nr:hypothetical protein J6590_042006 [Homalodisca vitripennis]